jgi:hypothetical protein
MEANPFEMTTEDQAELELALRQLVDELERWLALPGAPTLPPASASRLRPLLVEMVASFPALPPEVMAQAAQLAAQVEARRLATAAAAAHAAAADRSDPG